MQSLAFLWFELQMTQQYLRDKTFGPGQSQANSENLNTPIGAGTLRRTSAKQVPRMALAFILPGRVRTSDLPENALVRIWCAWRAIYTENRRARFPR
jgi:hypothetical protein